MYVCMYVYVRLFVRLFCRSPVCCLFVCLLLCVCLFVCSLACLFVCLLVCVIMCLCVCVCLFVRVFAYLFYIMFSLLPLVLLAVFSMFLFYHFMCVCFLFSPYKEKVSASYHRRYLLLTRFAAAAKLRPRSIACDRINQWFLEMVPWKRLENKQIHKNATKPRNFST